MEQLLKTFIRQDTLVVQSELRGQMGQACDQEGGLVPADVVQVSQSEELLHAGGRQDVVIPPGGLLRGFALRLLHGEAAGHLREVVSGPRGEGRSDGPRGLGQRASLVARRREGSVKPIPAVHQPGRHLAGKSSQGPRRRARTDLHPPPARL
uniref:Uncharacterized protein n=1 Tax=Micrurus corallinus TaxID=54390 RepID=A0A2D4FHG0_MICCO